MAQLTARWVAALQRSWPIRITLIYLASRLLSGALMLLFAAMQGPTSYTGARPDYVSFANFWDAKWYEYIAAAGYPTTLPIDAAGHVAQNAWAFLPVYPLLVGGTAALSQVNWAAAAIIVSLLAGWGFALLCYRLMRDRLTEGQATWAVVFAVVAPAAPLFGVAYAEPVFLMFLALTLLMLTSRHYAMVAPLLLILAFTRPGALALALTIGIHWILRWRARREDPFPTSERVGVALLAVWAGVLGFAWLVISGLTTGVWDAYLQTEFAWRAAYIGWVDVIPGTGWFQAAQWWLGQPWGVLVPIAVVAGFIALLCAPATRRLGTVMLAWIGSYALYLFLVFFPQSSTIRILAPMFPIAGVVAQLSRTWIKVLIALACVAGQMWWLYTSWVVIGSDWTPP